jgi:esterase/lipase
MRIIRFFSFLLVLLLIAYFSGPNPDTPNYTKDLPNIPSGAIELENYVAKNESKRKLKPDNEARIVWADTALKQPTEYAIVYLHGFSASQEEGDPVHENIARKFGCNMYLARLAEHGIDTTDQLLYLTADKYWETVKEAYAIGKRLGKKVIVMGTSTGATNALHLASEFPDVYALILLSPNIEINNGTAWIANNPWGLQVGRYVVGSKEFTPADTTIIYSKYWNTPYRLEAIVALQEYLETTMKPSTYEKIKQPVLMLYYYKNEADQDKVVKVSAMLKMFHALQTPGNLKKSLPVPSAGDHVIAGSIKSKDILTVENEITSFMNTTLHIPARD